MLVEEDRLVAIGEIAQMLNVTPQWADVLTRQKGFPDPAHVLSAGRIWRYADILTWAVRSGRDVTPLSEDPQPPSPHPRRRKPT